MLPDFEMIVHTFPEKRDITIIPIADVHLGAPECMEQEFIKFIDSMKDREDVFFVLCGDLVSNGVKNSVTNVYEEVYRPASQKKMMAKILEPIAPRVLAVVNGNHERRSGKEVDDSPCYDICAKLDIEDRYRENMAFIKIQIGNRNDYNGRTQRPTYTIVVTHGAGGGAMTGGGINRNERFGYAIDNMDCLISAHTHRPAITQPGKIFIDTYNNKVTIKPFKVVTATSWLTSGGYALQKMLTPNSHALQTLTLRGDRKEMVVTM